MKFRQWLSSDRGSIVSRAFVAFLLAAAYAFVSHAESLALQVNRVTAPVHGLPGALEGLRVAQVTDLHSSRYGENQRQLLDEIAAFAPDLIAITGDFIDGIHPDETPCAEFVRGAVALAPVYWVRGNHEYYLDTDERLSFEADMAALGARLLDNQAVVLERHGQRYVLAGMNDVLSQRGDLRAETEEFEPLAMEYARSFMARIDARTPAGEFPFKLMLCHRPAYWQCWRASGYSLSLSGHLHGWVLRAPAFGGVPRRPSRYFPEEDAGLYRFGDMYEYISRGLDNRQVLRNFRMNNPPELSLIEIVKE